MLVRELFEEKEINDREFTRMMNGFEKQLPHESRYKKWDYYPYKKLVTWVTQATEPEESQTTAETLAKLLAKAGYHGWTVKVVLRDLNNGKNIPWKKAISEATNPYRDELTMESQPKKDDQEKIAKMIKKATGVQVEFDGSEMVDVKSMQGIKIDAFKKGRTIADLVDAVKRFKAD